MENWIIIGIFIIAAAVVIGNLSMVQKSAKQKLRKTGLNDLQETLPRTNKVQHKMETLDKTSQHK